MSEMNNLTIGKDYAEKAAEDTINDVFKQEKEIEQIDIDFLLHDIIIIKAESLKYNKIFNYADYLEKQLLKIKRKEAELQLWFWKLVS